MEPGPQDGTLLVTWLPVTANVTASSTNVTGYAVYADGKKVTDVDSPTGKARQHWRACLPRRRRSLLTEPCALT